MVAAVIAPPAQGAAPPRQEPCEHGLVDATGPEPLLKQRFTTLARHLTAVRTGEPRAVHQARVATRRLRETLALVPARGPARKAREAVRTLTQLLGPVREIDVMLETVEELARATLVSAPAARALRFALQRDRRRQHRKAVAAIEDLDLPRVRRKLLGEAVAPSPASIPAARVRTGPGNLATARHRAARRARDLRAAINDAAGLYVPERLHEVRIAVKKLRYALEVVHAVRTAPPRTAAAGRPPRTAAPLAVLKRAQELLGRMHDFEVLIARVRQLQGTADAPDLRVSGDLDRLVRTLETECRLLHAHYMTLRPGLLAICVKVAR